ncbi:MAG: twin-arginine translocase TatA/TatE family subunit [Spirochaetes bacterium]|nr:twin-arginine translocase TatA/TatE family subunit [Spirochaetota bacterium]HPA73391.1 twin-arginine translocase TatA/TatE family subunit [Spirochaetota bacterium]
MIGNIGLPELIIIFLIVLFLFGAGKIPKIARDIGGGIREFKKSITGERDNDGNGNNNNQNSGSGRTS